MTKYEEFESRKIKTIEELIKALSLLNPKTKIEGVGADCGGYDVCGTPYCIIDYNDKTDTISISNMEYEIYEAYQKKEITLEEYNILNEEID